MKTLVTSFAALFAAASTSLAQITIISLDRAGTLSWSNRLCTSLPVYDVLRASSPTGTWQHVAFVTNQTSFTIPNFPGAEATAFLKLAWVSHAPIEFDYVFDEGYALPAVVGRLNLDFIGGRGPWAFQETEFVIDGLHPTVPARWSECNSSEIYSASIWNQSWMAACISKALSRGCKMRPGVSTPRTGTAYEADFGGGGTEIGTFVATKAP
jgi:hypothetical protein